MQPGPTPKVLEAARLCGRTLAGMWLKEGQKATAIKPRLEAKLERILAPECRSPADFHQYLEAYLRGADDAIQPSDALGIA